MPIENERKYVLLYSDIVEKVIAEQAEQTLRIEQKYLSIEKGFSVRVRNTSNDGIHSYRLTVKKDIGGKVVEIETVISEEDFKRLWPTGKNRVVKTRYIYQGWEIDFFKNNNGHNYFSIAEIELLSWQKSPSVIPDLVKNYLLFTVPIADKRFSNKKLGNQKYAEKLFSWVKKNSNAHIVTQPDLKIVMKKLK